MKSGTIRRRGHAGNGKDGNRADRRKEVRRSEFTAVAEALRDVNNVTREEFVAATDDIHRSLRDLETQFTRIAQIQAELDHIKRMLAKLTGG